jgi:hypothetical protein
VAFVCAAATAARRQTNIDVNVILGTTQYHQNAYGVLEAICGQKEGHEPGEYGISFKYPEPECKQRAWISLYPDPDRSAERAFCETILYHWLGLFLVGLRPCHRLWKQDLVLSFIGGYYHAGCGFRTEFST